MKSVKVLGAFIGDDLDCSERLVARVRKQLAPLEQMIKLRDTAEIKVAMQVQLEINRYCANTQLIYFLRSMPLAATWAAARCHDQLIWQAAEAVVGMQQATRAERARAKAQARLPVKLGGLGLTAMATIARAARIGTWALCWRPMRTLLPRVFGEVDVATAMMPSFVELRASHEGMAEMWRRTEGVYKAFDTKVFDYNREGEVEYQFHPAFLPMRHELVDVAEFASESDHLKNAQRTWSRIAHHSAWLHEASRLRQVSAREVVRFVSVSQPHAGDFLNAVPKRAVFRINTWAMRIAVQRRLGLPLTAAEVGSSQGRSRHGHVFDVMGDLATNDGKAGWQARHHSLLEELVRVLRGVWGARVDYEPADYRDSLQRHEAGLDDRGRGCRWR